MPTLSKKVFEKKIKEIFTLESRIKRPYIILRAGDLHQELGDYPDPQKHRMPLCCEAMRNSMKRGDEIKIKGKPPKGDGANLVIRYNFPR